MNNSNITDHSVGPVRGQRDWLNQGGRTSLLLAFAISSILLGGCASTKITSDQMPITERLPRPNHIYVYDFASTPADLPPNSPLAAQNPGYSLPPEQVALGRQLGSDMASQLVDAIREMGLPAERASAATTPQPNDLVLRGYLVSVDEGSAAKRFTIGFGSGASQLTTFMEGFQMTPQGLRKLGSGTATAGGNKSPGTAVGAATFAASGNPAGLIVSSGMKVYGEASGRSKVEGRAKQTVKEIAERLKLRFKEQGWVSW